MGFKRGKKAVGQKLRKQEAFEGLKQENANAAGLDIGSAEIWASVPEERSEQPVRSFGTFTPDLNELAAWLKECQIETVAMESTGVYWIPIYEILEEGGFRVHLVNARHMKNVPGRKSDVLDCQWIQRLHSYGLLSGSFRPEAEMCALRGYLRHRRSLLEYRAGHIQHLQKALHQMNVQLTQVLSDLTGVTGLAILRAIVRGKRDPVQLAKLRDGRCAKSEEEIVKALTGHYAEEHVFALKQALELYEIYTKKIKACDQEIERKFRAIRPKREEPLPPIEGKDKRNTHSKNGPDYDARTLLYEVTGVDLVAIDGLNAVTVQTLLAEVGIDLKAWPTEKHFCSWLGLAPHNDISGGKILRSKTLKNRNRAGQVFRLAAQSVSRSQSSFGAFYRQMKRRLGPKEAIVATAHKIARTFYHLLKYREKFCDLGAAAYEQRFRDREIANLKRKASKYGLALVLAPT